MNWMAPSNLKAVTVTVSVNDGVSGSVTKLKRVSITFRNRAPVIQEIVVSERVHAVSNTALQAVVYDANGDTLTYSWEVKKGVLDLKTTLTPTWTAPIDIGFVTVALTVDDGVNELVTKSVVVQIVHALIAPGEEAAGIKLGDTFDRVKTLYGRPSKRNSDFFAYWDPDIGLSGFFDGIGLVEGLSIRKPNKAKTIGGVGIGSTLKRVEEEFGGAEKVEEGGKIHWYWKKGIEFIVDLRINETLQTGAVRIPHLPFSRLVGTVSNCAYAVRLETAPTGGRKCLFIFRIYYSYDADSKVRNISIFKPSGAAPAGFDGTLLRE